MPGTFIVRPIEANLTHNTDFLKKMNPYCSIAVGNTRIKGQICKHGGKHPHWNDAITIPATNESQVLVQLMDKDRLTHDDNIGSFMLNLQEVQQAGQVSKWYPLYYKNKAAGEILLETVFQPDNLGGLGGQGQYYQGGQQFAGAGLVGQTGYSTGLAGQQYSSGLVGQTGYGQNQYYQQEQVLTSQPQVVQEEIITTTQPAEVVQTQETVTTTTTTTQPAAVIQEEVIVNEAPRGHVWTEQHQVVEPHKFIKEVEVVETRPAMKEIEVMEPVKVVKEVPFTQAVPVKKQIEVMEPQVVVKEVEVIEPRLVTKTIQVVENVPVTRQVEVVEMRNAIQEIETVEPQTFTKQVEVTEYVPVKKAVEVTQPVVLKKAVEFVEPVITTQTITKQMQEAVIIDEQITTTVGPASVVGISQEYGYIQNWGEISLTERQRISGLERWIGFEKLFTGLSEQERLFEQQRLSRLSEQEWIREQQRLLAMAEQDRINHQRQIYSSYYSTNRQGGLQTGYQGGLQTGYQGGLSTGHKRWHGFEHLFGGLNEKERQFEQERWNRLSEQEWLQEQQRLSGFNEQQRLLEQRRLYNDYLQTGGFSTYKKTTQVVEQTNTSDGQQGFIQGNQGFVQSNQGIAGNQNPIC